MAETSAPTSPDATSPVAENSPAAPAGPTFADLGLPGPALAAVEELGYSSPSPIQESAIPVLLQGKDLIGIAQTGTGKTAAYGLPLISALEESSPGTQSLVLAPTRELAQQVADAVSSFAVTQPWMRVTAVYGGAPYYPQERALSRGAHVVVGTPGRVIDHLERGNLVLDSLRFLVLDEADEMLNMGFQEEVERILSFASGPRQTALFSATMPPAIERVAGDHMTDPVNVSVARQATTVTTIEQSYAVVPFKHKIGAISRILATTEAEASLVFVRTRAAAEEVGSALIAKGLVAATLSGDVAQKDRERIVERLRNGSVDVVVATDVAARGLDVERIGLVVNFDVPGEPEAYVHRIGRTGRAGRAGRAITFVTPRERGKLRAIEKVTRQKLAEMPIPSPLDVSTHRTDKLLEQVSRRVDAGRLGMYREHAAAFLASHPELDSADLVAALLAMSVGDDGPGAATDEEEFTGATLAGSDREDRAARGSKGTDQKVPPKGWTRYKIAVGRKHGVSPAGIVGAMTGEAGLRGKDIGHIGIYPAFTLVDVQGELSREAIEKIGKARVAGHTMRLRKDAGPRASDSGSGPKHRRFEKRERS